MPSSITRKLDLAIARTELAPSETPKKAKRLYKSVRHLLTKAGKLTTRAARGRHPKLSAQCAADLLDALHAGGVLVGSGA